MNKTGIEWCDMTWNPVTGCRHGCDYCYARRIAERFGTRLPDRSGYPDTHNGVHVVESKIKGNPYPYKFEPTFLPFRLVEPLQKRQPQNIFVCSMADLFGRWVPDEWIGEVFQACEKAPQHNYLFLTKNPQRYVDLYEKGMLPMEDNMWYGTTVTGPDDRFMFSVEHRTFLSIEPMMGQFVGVQDYESLVKKVGACRGPDWVIIGAMTGPEAAHHPRPQKEWVLDLAEDVRRAGVPVFMKDSLLQIVGKENMCREIPELLRAVHMGLKYGG